FKLDRNDIFWIDTIAQVELYEFRAVGVIRDKIPEHQQRASNEPPSVGAVFSDFLCMTCQAAYQQYNTRERCQFLLHIV
ncbi:hypothetical protein NK983_25745, partial [Salmonella enterica subsp. enterica serovar Typhimurium]|nr:hypothetical protein [Salmonella enterica subsp. enterica serovar Typhimurium]